MVPRDSRTGSVFEQMIIPSLKHSGYFHTIQVDIGSRLGGGRCFFDVLILMPAKK
ncbi:MAG TPA: hypothetical protein VLH18_06035 [Candidatus Limnocylindrales bacterium]|nr:hypothetical protein [Candidatus Limnocylindrales bacterium]